MVDQQVHQLQGKLELIRDGETFALKFDDIVISFDNTLEMSFHLEEAANRLRGFVYAGQILSADIPERQRKAMISVWEAQSVKYKDVFDNMAALCDDDTIAKKLYLRAGDNYALAYAALALYFGFHLTNTEIDILTTPYKMGRNA